MNNLIWKTKSFEELAASELYEILHLRQEIFIVEQQCVYNDLDKKDQFSRHLTAHDFTTRELVAYARLIPPGITFDQASIGRVVVRTDYRGNGMGGVLMQKAMKELWDWYGLQPICIGAQSHLQTFYKGLGFKPIGGEYDDAGIPHIDMIFTE